MIFEIHDRPLLKERHIYLELDGTSDLSDVHSFIATETISSMRVKLNEVISEDVIKQLAKYHVPLEIVTSQETLNALKQHIATLGLVDSVENNQQITIHMTPYVLTDGLIHNNIKKLERMSRAPRHLTASERTIIQEAVKHAATELEQQMRDYKVLKQRYERLQAQVKNGTLKTKDKDYAALYEKYRDALNRLDNLRNSKLGKLQMKYWELRK